MSSQIFLQRYKDLGHNIDPNIIKLPNQTLRVNTLKISEENLITRLKQKNVKLRKVPFTDHGYEASSKFSLGSTPEYLQGYYYLQESASQVPTQILSPKQEDLVLDMCASPGSKTTQLAQQLKNQSTIVALDLNNKKLSSLRNNISRLGITNTILYNLDALESTKLKLEFDKILLDAPCSGNFTLEKNWFKKRSIKDFKKVSEKQKSLLKAAFNVLKPNGTIVYSTCSLEPEEDEEIVQYALDNLSAKLIPITEQRYDLAKNPDLPGTLKFWPEITNTQGFFIARLSKN
jgi:tRNA (cytosine40_48-C5)-methyltransferase